MSGFEEYKADREAGFALFLESGDEDALWIAQAEEDVPTGVFVVNPDEGGGPEGEVEAVAKAYHMFGYFCGVGVVGFNAEDRGEEVAYRAGFGDFLDEWDGRHFFWYVLAGDNEVGDVQLCPIAYGALTGEGVEGGVYHCLATVVFFQDCF